MNLWGSAEYENVGSLIPNILKAFKTVIADHETQCRQLTIGYFQVPWQILPRSNVEKLTS